MEIIPSIVPKHFYDIEERIRSLEGHVSWVHLDIADGVFAGPATWPYTEGGVDGALAALRELKASISIEVHLMVNNPEDKLDQWMDTPVKRIVIHHESSDDIEDALLILDMSRVRPGLAISYDTPIDAISEHAERFDCLELMSIKRLGHSGEPFESGILAKIAEVKKKYPNTIITVDGGISEENIKSVIDAGADNVIVGHVIAESAHPAETILKLRAAVEKI